MVVVAKVAKSIGWFKRAVCNVRVQVEVVPPANVADADEVQEERVGRVANAKLSGLR
jgi:hypothetical protein